MPKYAVGAWRGSYYVDGNFPKQGEPQYRPLNTIVLILGTPKMVPPIYPPGALGSQLGA